MTVSDLLPFIRILSNFRKCVEESRQDKPLKATQPGFLSVPHVLGTGGSLFPNGQLNAVKVANIPVF